MSTVTVRLEDGFAGDQCADEGVEVADDGASETMLQRQCVRVGAAYAVEKRSAARSGVDSWTSIIGRKFQQLNIEDKLSYTNGPRLGVCVWYEAQQFCSDR
jgi:hypothetical protein